MFCTWFEGILGWLEFSSVNFILIFSCWWTFRMQSCWHHKQPLMLAASAANIHLKYLCCCNSQAAQLRVKYGREKWANRVQELQRPWTECSHNIEYSTHSVGDRALSGRREDIGDLCLSACITLWCFTSLQRECETDCSIGVTEVDCTDNIFYPRDLDKLMT